MRTRARTAAFFERLTHFDLAVAIGWTGLTAVVLALSAAIWDFVVIFVGFPFVLFVPGYVVVAALFPEAHPTDSSGISRSSITVLERIALSTLFSIIVTVFVGLGIDALSIGFGRWSLFTGLTLVVAVGTVVAIAHRHALSDSQRVTVTADQTLSALGWRSLVGSRFQMGLNAVLILSVLTAGVAVATDLTQDKTAYTEAYLLSENESGELIADGYPTTMTRGEPSELVLGLENHEDEPINYTVVVKLQQVRDGENGLTVEEETRLTTVTESLDADEKVHREHQITPPRSGQSQRLVYLVYESTPPTDPSIETAEQEVHLWVTVTEGASADASGPESSEDSS